jgi:hypothetical protein
MSEAEKAVNHLISEIELKLTKKYHMRTTGIVVGMPGGIVKELGIKFQIEGPLSKQALRELLIFSTQDFVDYLNANQKIQPFLEKQPFGIKNVEITLFLIDSSGMNIDHPHIGIAGICRGVLYYLTLKDSDMPPAKTRTEESYEEAIRILREQTVSLSNDHDKVVDVKSPENAHPKYDQYSVNEAE